tara:strand:+ start:231 stop:665 length:435 start_codon:yes stop_codon:yes gene_type:complete
MTILPFDLQMRICKEAVLLELKERIFKKYRFGKTSFLTEEGFIEDQKYICKSCGTSLYFNNYHLYCVPGKRKRKFTYHTKDMKTFENYLYTNYPESLSSKSFGMFSLLKTKTKTLKKILLNNNFLKEDIINLNKKQVIHKLMKL